jgi:hypothetical protein
MNKNKETYNQLQCPDIAMKLKYLDGMAWAGCNNER